MSSHDARVARRIIAAESWLLAVCVAITGWTPENVLRLDQVASATAAAARMLDARAARPVA